jgi:hypothetical protein
MQEKFRSQGKIILFPSIAFQKELDLFGVVIKSHMPCRKTLSLGVNVKSSSHGKLLYQPSLGAADGGWRAKPCRRG